MEGWVSQFCVLGILHLLVLALVPLVNSKIVEKHKGHELSLKFTSSQFHQNCSFQLFFNNSLFDNNGTSVHSSIFTPRRFNRTHVNSEDVFGTLIVHLRIQPIHKSDAGLFNCSFQCPDSRETQHYSVKVIFPPKLKNCSWTVDTRVQHEGLTDYSKLDCSSIAGYPVGTVLCYTQDSGVPDAHLPLLSSGVQYIKTTFWLPDNLLVSCCSVSDRYQKKFNKCTDFVFPQITPTITPHSTLKIANPPKDSVQSNSKSSSRVLGLQTNICACLFCCCCYYMFGLCK